MILLDENGTIHLGNALEDEKLYNIIAELIEQLQNDKKPLKYKRLCECIANNITELSMALNLAALEHDEQIRSAKFIQTLNNFIAYANRAEFMGYRCCFSRTIEILGHSVDVLFAKSNFLSTDIEIDSILGLPIELFVQNAQKDGNLGHFVQSFFFGIPKESYHQGRIEAKLKKMQAQHTLYKSAFIKND